MNKEEIYDEEISPLMAQILDICKTHKIGMVASFALPTSDDAALRCTSALTEDACMVDVQQVEDYRAACVAILLHGVRGLHETGHAPAGKLERYDEYFPCESSARDLRDPGARWCGSPRG